MTEPEVWKRGEPQKWMTDFYDDRECDVCCESFGRDNHNDTGILMTHEQSYNEAGAKPWTRTLRAFVHEGCASKVESEGSSVVLYHGQRHRMERVTVYQMTCGNCGKSWYENWGSMDDMCGSDPEYGMEADCEHCKTELPVHIPEPNE